MTTALGPRRAAAADHGQTWWSRWWLAASGLTLVVASDYDLRTRPPGDAVGASVDAAILLEIALYGAVGAHLLLTRARPPRVVRAPRQLFLLVLYVGLVVLSLTYTPYLLYGAVRAVQMCVLLGLALAAARDARPEHLHRFAHGFLVLVALSVCYGAAVPSAAVSALQEGRFTWLAIHPTVSGVLTGLAVVIGVGYLWAGARPRSGPRWPTGAYGLLLLVVGGGLLATQTRGAVLAAGVASVVVLVSLRTGRALVELLLALLVLGAGAALALSGVITAYVVRGEDPSALVTLNSRTMLWRLAGERVLEEPLYGYGTTAARGIFYAETGLGGGHNAVVNVVVELGLVGLAVWAALLVVLVLGVRGLPRDASHGVVVDRALLLGLVAFLLVDGVVYEGAGAVTNVGATWLFVCVAWLTVAQRAARGDGVHGSVPASTGVRR
ncbi:O-antigen ligase family protein [uncultured Pseudokineococcus sp.]|uniref:O-antigen ligase family protein n=1 Tax=uncultured Pseudokineococcus sp. TaxID=1642928 RepID=UPI0026388B1C|nr:O-antigen ligase family protein [uncultured Pseudokineococcus sp.]